MGSSGASGGSHEFEPVLGGVVLTELDKPHHGNKHSNPGSSRPPCPAS